MTGANPTLVFRRRRLPHWLVAEHAYFVTLCRKGCLPARVTAELRAEREAVARDVSDRASRSGRSDTSRPTCSRPDEGGSPVARDVSDRAGGMSDDGRSDTSRPTRWRADAGGSPVARDVSDRAGGMSGDGRSDTSRPTCSRPDAGGSPVARDVSDRADDHVARDDRRLSERRRRFVQIDAILDAAARSPRDLCAPAFSVVVLGNLDWLRGRGWRIWAATLMPSHMHLVLRNTEGQNDALCSDLALFMSWTARQVNAAMETRGSFWQPEPFDHWCRDADAWLRSVGYTLHNPVKAGLCAAWRDWPHTVADPEVEGLIP